MPDFCSSRRHDDHTERRQIVAELPPQRHASQRVGLVHGRKAVPDAQHHAPVLQAMGPANGLGKGMRLGQIARIEGTQCDGSGGRHGLGSRAVIVSAEI